MGLRRTSIIFAAIALSFGDSGAVGNSSAEEFSPDPEKLQVIEKAVEPWSIVNRWLIEYEAMPSTAATGGISVHKIMAVSAPGDFYHYAKHFPPSNPWQVDPFCQEFFIHQGITCHRWHFNRTYSEGMIKAGDPIPGSIWMDVLLAIIPRWPFSDYKIPSYP